MFGGKNKLDFLAIGDITTDVFIRLEDAHVNCKLNKEDCELCMNFGDKIPYKDMTVVRAVGNSPNAAVCASRLGLKAGLLTNIGDDEGGRECLKSLQEDKVSVEYIQTEKGKTTNRHFVLWYEVDRTILVKHTKFDYKLPKLPKASWVYLSSMADNSLPYHAEIAEYLKQNPETNLAFQPGTFQMKMDTEKLKDIYQRTKIFFCNKEEAERILHKEAGRDILELSKGINALGPEMVVISDGPKGAYLYAKEELWYIPMYPDIAPPLDRTGAGDAFSSTFVAALALGKTPTEALSWGPINSMSVVQEIGAQAGLLNKEKLIEYIKKAPQDYKVVKK